MPTVFRAPDGTVVAEGYERVLYGDHGPYLECSVVHVRFRHLRLQRKVHPGRFYDEWLSPDGRVRVYDQLRSVADQPNPPPGARSTHNHRPDGYADYRVGRCYIALDAALSVDRD